MRYPSVTSLPSSTLRFTLMISTETFRSKNALSYVRMTKAKMSTVSWSSSDLVPCGFETASGRDGYHRVVDTLAEGGRSHSHLLVCLARLSLREKAG